MVDYKRRSNIAGAVSFAALIALLYMFGSGHIAENIWESDSHLPAALFVTWAGAFWYGLHARRKAKSSTMPTQEAYASDEVKEPEPTAVAVRELSEEEECRQIETLEKIKILCRIQAMRLDDLDDDGERAKFAERIEQAIGMAREISDPFYFASALHFVITLAWQAGWHDKANELLSLVQEPFVREKIVEDLKALRS